VEKTIKRENKNSFTFGLKVEISGLKTFNKSDDMYLFCVLFFHLFNAKKPKIINGMTRSK